MAMAADMAIIGDHSPEDPTMLVRFHGGLRLLRHQKHGEYIPLDLQMCWSYHSRSYSIEFVPGGRISYYRAVWSPLHRIVALDLQRSIDRVPQHIFPKTDTTVRYYIIQ